VSGEQPNGRQTSVNNSGQPAKQRQRKQPKNSSSSSQVGQRKQPKFNSSSLQNEEAMQT